MGRSTKLTPELQESVCAALRAGNYVETAVLMNGISKVSLYTWLKRGGTERERLGKPSARPKKSETPYLNFLYAVEKAQAMSEVRDVALIGKAAETQWQAAAWRLERKNYERWGRKQMAMVIENATLNREIIHVRMDGREEDDETEKGDA